MAEKSEVIEMTAQEKKMFEDIINERVGIRRVLENAMRYATNREAELTAESDKLWEHIRKSRNEHSKQRKGWFQGLYGKLIDETIES